MRLFVLTICALMLSLVVQDLSAQSRNKQGVEEEVVRYMGYEEVPTRYLSLPYDMAMDHNVERNYVDIGYVLICLLPLLWLWRIRHRWHRLIVGLGLLVMCCLSIASSIMINDDYQKVSYEDGSLSEYIGSMAHVQPKLFVAKTYELVGSALAPLRVWLSEQSENGDHMTYPLCITILVILYFIYQRSQKRTAERYYMGLFMLGYAMYMWLFSGGIIWYMYVILPLLYLELIWYAPQSRRYTMLLALVGLSFVGSSYVLKHTNVYFMRDEPIALVPSAILDHQIRGTSEGDLYEAYFANVNDALRIINADEESMVLQVGSSIKFLIEGNHKRVVQDPVLNSIYRLINKYKTRSNITRALRIGGVKYIVVSPNLPAMDQTPDRTLQRKYEWLLGYLEDNPYVKLLATDRVIRKELSNGRMANVYGFFGNEVVTPGQYAIFEVIDP